MPVTYLTELKLTVDIKVTKSGTFEAFCDVQITWEMGIAEGPVLIFI